MKNSIFMQRIILFSLYVSVGWIYASRGLWDKSELAYRRHQAKAIRFATARAQASKVGITPDETNGDLERYKDRRGSFSKSLKHHDGGIVKERSFCSLLQALESGDPCDFNAIVLGGARHLTNPQAAYAFTLEGSDPAAFIIPPAPSFASAESASEMVELYWGVLLRDVPFNQYASNAIAARAIASLNSMSCFRGPKHNCLVDAQTLWRGITPGELVGPYISQFLYQPIPMNGKTVEQLYFSYAPGIENDFMTTFAETLLIQNGGSSGKSPLFNASPQYIFTGRDLGTYVHKDFSSQAYMNAALILLGYGTQALDQNNPYVGNPTQDGFVTYGGPHIIALLNYACEAAFKATWYQKWLVHLRLRPEYFGLLVDRQIVAGADYCIHTDLLHSSVLQEIFDGYGSYVLPQMYSEGSPVHPSYPAGHAAVAGACITMLKAFFNENFVIPHPLQPNGDNTNVEHYDGILRVGDELNKLASNISLGRDFAGVHYRSDAIEGMMLGENVAIDILCDEAYLYNEPFEGFTLTKFDGETIVIGKKVCV